MAAGSHSTYGGWESRVCEGCGGRITLTGKNASGVMFRHGPPARSRHADCSWKESLGEKAQR